MLTPAKRTGHRKEYTMPDKKRTAKNTAEQYATMDQEEHRKFEGKKRHRDHHDPVDELVENPREEERVARKEKSRD